MESLLSQNNIAFLRIDGRYTLEQRKDIVEQFQSLSDIKVLLLTLSAGSVGYVCQVALSSSLYTFADIISSLNLTAASQVHILEPHWNPMVEAQAAARVHRLDQKEQVVIYRYVVKNSIEENIQKMQRRKRWYASLSLTQGEEHDAKRNIFEDAVAELGKDMDSDP